MKKLNIVIIGGGWYGCYSALLLQKNHNVTLIDKEKNIFEKSSYYNQNRLHLGYHYCRDYKTRILCKNGYNRFIENFGNKNIINNLDKNYYLISNKSIIDFKTIYSIYKYEDYNFDLVKNIIFNNIDDNILNVDECVINSKNTKFFFENNIKCNKIFNKKIIKTDVDKKPKVILDDDTIIYCDIIIDCTFNSLNLSSKQYIYEKTISLLYKNILKTDFDAITIIDGNFFSLYPHDIDNNIYTLTDVEFTPLIKSTDLDVINDYIFNEEKLDYIKDKMEDKIIHYFSNFKNHFEYVGYFISNKTKLENNSDSRECNIENINNKLITINCGKITGIFVMEDYFKKIGLIT